MDNLLEQAIRHRTEHDCSAMPYEHADQLVKAVQDFGARQILEIGTGMGYSATIMAKVNPAIHIDTIEKDADHVLTAKKFWHDNNVAHQIKAIQGHAEIKLGDLTGPYDLIFFDGFQIHYEFLPHYERLLKPGGILFLANNHLKSKTSDHFFEELHNPHKWEILNKFDDTTVAKKLPQ